MDATGLGRCRYGVLAHPGRIRHAGASLGLSRCGVFAHAGRIGNGRVRKDGRIGRRRGAASVFPWTVRHACIVTQTAHIVVAGGATSAADNNREEKKEVVLSHGELPVGFHGDRLGVGPA
jgi:hypothetical protein